MAVAVAVFMMLVVVPVALVVGVVLVAVIEVLGVEDRWYSFWLA